MPVLENLVLKRDDYTAKDNPYTGADCVPGSYWCYAPNKVAPIIFCILFTASGAVHFYQTWKHKSWRYTLLMPWAALLMCAGFATREAAAYHFSDLNLLIASTVLIMSGPPVYAAINYFVLSRIMFYMPWLSPIHPGRIVITFLAIDSIIEILIGNGVSRVTNQGADESVRHTGDVMVKTSLCIQAVMFIVFIGFGAYIHIKAQRAGCMPANGRLAKVMYVMYISSVVVLVRCLYRIVEYFEGWGGYLNTHEAFFWVFDASLMLINTVFLNVWHPGARLPSSNTTFLARDGFTELTGPGFIDNRSLLQKLVDPFDLIGLISGSDKNTKFWEMTPTELEEYTARETAASKKIRWF